MAVDQIHEIEISAILYQEGVYWVAQGLEYDITAQAESLPVLKERFATKVAIEVAVSLDLNRKPLDGVGRAPERFWRMFREATTTDVPQNRPVLVSTSGHASPEIPRIVHTMKVRLPKAA